MARRIRKQVYIDKRHEQTLKRLARERGVTEAEIVREALDYAESAPTRSRQVPDPEAARKLLASMRNIGGRASESAPRERWTRESLYDERISRWIKS